MIDVYLDLKTNCDSQMSLLKEKHKKSLKVIVYQLSQSLRFYANVSLFFQTVITDALRYVMPRWFCLIYAMC